MKHGREESFNMVVVYLMFACHYV